MEQSYKSTMNPILSRVDDKKQKDSQVAFGYSRIKSFRRGETPITEVGTRRRRSAAEEIFAEFEAIFDVLGESNGDEGVLVPEAKTDLIRKISDGVERELIEISANPNENYVPGELNFFRKITGDDVAPPVMEDAVLATYGDWITDCNCDNQTRADYALCTPVNPEVHVR